MPSGCQCLGQYPHLVPMAFSPLNSALVYGYVCRSIVTGFLLTAIPNWTGRLPVTGGPLLALIATCAAAGRLAILASARIGAPLRSGRSFSVSRVPQAGVIARKIAAGRNVRNSHPSSGGATVIGPATQHLLHWKAVTARRRQLQHARLASASSSLLITRSVAASSSFAPQVASFQPPGWLPAPTDVSELSALAQARWPCLLLSPPTTGRPGRQQTPLQGEVAHSREKAFMRKLQAIVAL